MSAAANAPTPHASTPTDARSRRRVLVSAFACSPIWGSEPGVGWRWALELSKRHAVTVLTHPYFRADIEAALHASPHPGLHFEYHALPGVGGHPHRQLNSRLYYLLWQWTARRRVAALLKGQPHDLIHHLTWGSYRLHCCLGGLGLPLVIGPIGGGEDAPTRLSRSWPWRERLFYRIRTLSIALSRWDPGVRWGMQAAQCILTKTRETRKALPAQAQARAFDASEIGIGDMQTRGPRARPQGDPLQLLYAGRLLGGKGMPYMLAAMRLLQARGVPVHLSVAGSGRLLPWLRDRIVEWRLGACVTLLGAVPRDQMNRLYDSADLLTFPSWHDSSGNVVTEALSRGLPVLCLDLGGPRYAVDPGCAVVVPTEGLDEDGLAHALADDIAALANDPMRLAALSQGASIRAGELAWHLQVARTYAEIERRLGWTAETGFSAGATA